MTFTHDKSEDEEINGEHWENGLTWMTNQNEGKQP